MAKLKINKTFDKIEALPSSGGMGELYKCYKGSEITIIKTIKDSIVDQEFIERFKREIRIIKNLNHKNVIKILDFNDISEPYWYEIEYAPHGDLKKLVPKILKDEDRINNIFLQICEGLNYLHTNSNPIIHRDLKPQNILVFDNYQGKITDMGLSKYLDRDTTPITPSGQGYGTYAYAPPEQFSNFKNIDAKSDIYSLGIILFEMFTNSYAIISADLDSLLPRPYNNIVRKMTSQNPLDRYQTVEELINDFNAKIKIYKKISAFSDPEEEYKKIIKELQNQKDRNSLLKLLKLLEDSKLDENFVWEKINKMPGNLFVELSKDCNDIILSLIILYQNSVEKVGVIPFPFKLMDEWTDFFEFIFKNSQENKIKKICLRKIIHYAIYWSQFYSVDVLSKLLIKLNKQSDINLAIDIIEEEGIRDKIANLMEDKKIDRSLKAFLFA